VGHTVHGRGPLRHLAPSGESSRPGPLGVRVQRAEARDNQPAAGAGAGMAAVTVATAASAILRSAMRSAAVAGLTPSASASCSSSRVVSKMPAARALARSKSKPWISSATWITPPAFTT